MHAYINMHTLKNYVFADTLSSSFAPTRIYMISGRLAFPKSRLRQKSRRAIAPLAEKPADKNKGPSPLKLKTLANTHTREIKPGGGKGCRGKRDQST